MSYSTTNYSFLPIIESHRSLFLTSKSINPTKKSLSTDINYKIVLSGNKFSKNTSKYSNYFDKNVMTEKFILPIKSNKIIKKDNVNKDKNDNEYFKDVSQYIYFGKKNYKKENSSQKLIKQRDIFQESLNNITDYTKIININENTCYDEEYEILSESTAFKDKFKFKTMFKVKDPEYKPDIESHILRKTLNFNFPVLKQTNKIETKSNKTFIFIEHNNSVDYKSRNNMRYYFIQLNYYRKIDKNLHLFNELINILSKKFRIPSNLILLYTKQANIIHNLIELPWNKTDCSVIVSIDERFQKKINLNKNFVYLINDLENHVKDNINNQIEIEKLGNNEIEDKAKNIIHLMQKDSDKDSIFLEKIDKILDKKNKIKTDNLIKIEKLFDEYEKTSKTEKIINEYLGKNESKAINSLEDYIKNTNIENNDNYKNLTKILKLYKESLKGTTISHEEILESEEKRGVSSDMRKSTLLLHENFEEIVECLDKQIKKWKDRIEIKQKKKEIIKKVNYLDNQINYVEENKKKFTTKKRIIELLNKKNQGIFCQNIPKIMKKTNFSRTELHSQQKLNYDINTGINYEIYRKGIHQVFLQSEVLAQRIFNSIDSKITGFLNWHRFLDLMEILKAKTLNEKIDLFIKIADEDGSGKLSKDKIFNLCKICLSKYLDSNNSDSSFLDTLSDYFTKLIFSAVNIDIEADIPLDIIKEAVLSEKEESDLLCMFCGADV